MIKVGFIGLGNMGLPMAINLSKSKKIDLIGYDVNKSSIKKLTSKKAKATSSLDEVIKFADVIITCVPGPKQIKQLSIGKNKIIDQLGKNKVWIDCSTNSLNCFNLLKQKLKSKINRFIDATISGGNLKAASGKLSIFIGGNSKTSKKLSYVFKILGTNLYYLNKPGAGYAAKIAQVSLCYLNYLSLSESLMLGVKSGIKPKTMLEIIDKSASGGYTSTRYGPNMINGDYDPSFFLGLSMKDLNLANEIIKLQKLNLPILNLTSKIYKKALKKYGPNSNHLKVIKLMEQNNKLTFAKER
jgi:3-hydroxyisobutyrate dehydrogenase-like beta-hydroxyacid dehydrogenase